MKKRKAKSPKQPNPPKSLMDELDSLMKVKPEKAKPKHAERMYAVLHEIAFQAADHVRSDKSLYAHLMEMVNLLHDRIEKIEELTGVEINRYRPHGPAKCYEFRKKGEKPKKASKNCNFNNRTLFTGDNLEIMRAMNSESVDLIATDPPYNTGKTWTGPAGSFKDSFSIADVDFNWYAQIALGCPAAFEVIKGVREMEKAMGL